MFTLRVAKSDLRAPAEAFSNPNAYFRSRSVKAAHSQNCWPVDPSRGTFKSSL
jgi:hypothetical protein